jgi:hypothetical protein
MLNAEQADPHFLVHPLYPQRLVLVPGLAAEIAQPPVIPGSAGHARIRRSTIRKTSSISSSIMSVAFVIVFAVSGLNCVSTMFRK